MKQIAHGRALLGTLEVNLNLRHEDARGTHTKVDETT